MFDTDGRNRAWVTLSENGAPSLNFSDGNGKKRGGFYVSKDSSSVLAFSDKHGDEHIGLRVWKGAAPCWGAPRSRRYGRASWKNERPLRCFCSVRMGRCFSTLRKTNEQ